MKKILNIIEANTFFITIIISMFVVDNVYSQSPKQFTFNFECETEILETTIEIEELIENDTYKMEFLENLYKLQECGLDSIDIDMISIPQILGTILISISKSNTAKENLKYHSIISEFQKMTTSESYLENRKIIAINRELRKLKVNQNDWKEHSKLFLDMGFTQEKLSAIEVLVKKATNRDVTYEELFKENQNEQQQQSYEDLYETHKNLTFEEIIKLNDSTNKTILIYFRGNRATNCQKIENYVLVKQEISRVLNENFIIVEQTVDDKTSLPENECYIKGRKQINTIGKRNIEMQTEHFGQNSQPLFVKLNKLNKLESAIGLTSENDFLDFLNK